MSNMLFSWVWKWFEPDGGPRYGGMNDAEWQESMLADLQDLQHRTGPYAPEETP